MERLERCPILDDDYGCNLTKGGFEILTGPLRKSYAKRCIKNRPSFRKEGDISTVLIYQKLGLIFMEKSIDRQAIY